MPIYVTDMVHTYLLFTMLICVLYQCSEPPSSYNPISLTNELYKIISYILVHKLKPIIGRLVGPMQSTFIPRKSIAGTIL